MQPRHRRKDKCEAMLKKKEDKDVYPTSENVRHQSASVGRHSLLNIDVMIGDDTSQDVAAISIGGQLPCRRRHRP